MHYIYRPCLTPVGQLSLPAKLSKIYGFSWGRRLQSIWQLGNPKYFSRLKWWCDAFHLGLKEHYKWIHVKKSYRQILCSSLAEDCSGSSVLLSLPWAFCCHLCKFSTWTKLGLGMIWHKLWQSHANCVTLPSPVVVNFSHMASIPPIPRAQSAILSIFTIFSKGLILPSKLQLTRTIAMWVSGANRISLSLFWDYIPQQWNKVLVCCFLHSGSTQEPGGRLNSELVDSSHFSKHHTFTYHHKTSLHEGFSHIRKCIAIFFILFLRMRNYWKYICGTYFSTLYSAGAVYQPVISVR